MQITLSAGRWAVLGETGCTEIKKQSQDATAEERKPGYEPGKRGLTVNDHCPMLPPSSGGLPQNAPYRGLLGQRAHLQAQKAGFQLWL